MREIKFRALFKDVFKQEYKWFYATVAEKPTIPINYGQHTPWEEAISVQDSKKIDIYEGDIIEAKTYHAIRRSWSSLEEIPKIEEEVQKQKDDVKIVRAPVTFEAGIFKWRYPVTLQHIAFGEYNKSGTMQYSTSSYEIRFWDFTVIGNIHQHKHLLEEHT